MPERIFKYHTTAELIAEVKTLGKSLASTAGATNSLRNSSTGFLVETADIDECQLRNRYMAGRWEIYQRGQGVDGNAAVAQCLALEPTNPFAERVMKISTQYC